MRAVDIMRVVYTKTAEDSRFAYDGS